MKQYTLTINGKPDESKSTFPVINPATEKIIYQCPCASIEQLSDTVFYAKEAFKTFKLSTLNERIDLLRQASKAVENNKQELAELLTQEQGKPLSDALDEIDATIDSFVEISKLEIPVTVMQDDHEATVQVHYKPRGVIAGILPWNFPVCLAAEEISRTIITGNTIIVKPSPETPLSTLLLGEIIRDIFPNGTVNILSGEAELGRELVNHPGISSISFTGSVATGKAIAKSAATDLKRVNLELGGNDATIVLPSADISKIVDEIFWGAFDNCGQICNAIKRIYVHNSIKQQLIDEMIKIAKTVKIGDGMDESTQVGPLCTYNQMQIVSELVEDARSHGAIIHTGGKKLSEKGFFYDLTIISNVTNGTRIVDEEQFGPAVPIIGFDTTEEVIALANDVSVGLSGSVWSEDIAEAIAIAHQLECGMPNVNCAYGGTEDSPFGGFKDSGIGRLGGQSTIQSLMETQVITIMK